MSAIRKIIHVDMDAFFASVEQRDFPELKGKPVAVGGSSERGVVAAASYEARKFGVFSAMSSKIAAKKCPGLIFKKARFEVYKEVSNQIREIFLSYTDLVEPLSLDEAYLDVTENKKGLHSAITIAKNIKKEILEVSDLTASAGVSYNKFLAKVASALKKPDGLTLIHPDKAEEFIATLPIEKFYGVGKVTAAKMKKMGLTDGAALRNSGLPFLIQHFGKSGRYYFDVSRGIDNRLVNPNRIRKSSGAENTFHEDVFSYEDLLEKAILILEKAYRYIEKSDNHAKTLTLKIKYNDFDVVTRSKTRPQPISDKEEALLMVKELIKEFDPPKKGVRLLGISFSNFDEYGIQLTLGF